MELKNIAIIGPRGNVGALIIKELLKDGDRYAITAITRPSSTYEPPPETTITAKSADFDSLASLTDAFVGQDAVVNCISGGATQYEPSKRIIDAAIAAGVKFFFANEFVGHVTSDQYKRMPEGFVGAKLRIRQYLEELGKKGELAWTALNGGPFFDMWLMKGPAGFSIPTKEARIYGTGANPLCWTPLPTMAFAAANMLRNPYSVANRPIYICPLPGLTQNSILAALEKVLETEFTVQVIDVKKINENARDALEKGEIAKAMRGLTISNQFYEGDSGNDFRSLVENETVGVVNVSLEEAVRQAVEKYGLETPVVESLFRVDP
ncbi:NAD(P)-binding protein [Amniculicola lignicola CBS 123094]|uniref:NAD(P)-binding protein n=1 Tax=Amniculicola lignicola CBS 123094 TaxID=1392246 RepID=A0A6A5W2K7_9PLEO|nr:NAD(P)-binding protein [Amniculicola lignicola CBS 123094]